MVGTAVYQVGRASSSQRKKLSALKPGVHTTLAAGGKRGEHRRDQAVDVEERHDVEAAVCRRRARASRRCGRAEAATLAWESGTSFGREVVPEVWRRSATSSGSARPDVDRSERRSVEGECRRPRSVVGIEPEDRDAEPLGDRDRGSGLVACDQDRLGADVGEIEVELLGAVGGIERRGRRRRRRATRRPSPSPARWRARWRHGRRGRGRARSSLATVRIMSVAQVRRKSATVVPARRSPWRHRSR